MLLIVIAVSLLATVNSQLTWGDVDHPTRPVINGVMGPYLNNPGLDYFPKSRPGNLLRIDKGNSSSFEHLIKQLRDQLAPYRPENLHSEEIYDCASIVGYRPTEDRAHPCRVDVTAELGSECVEQVSFGYEDGMPCVLLKMDRLRNWLPEAYTNETVPDVARSEFEKYHVTVTCEGEEPVSIDNLGPVTVWPRGGFHVKYFPDVGSEAYLPPLVFVQFARIQIGMVVNIQCKIWARNVIHSSKLHTGMASFSLLVD